jgi:type II secretory pathway component PulF
MSAPDNNPTGANALKDFVRLNEEIMSIVRARLPLEPHLERISRELPVRTGQMVERIRSRLAAGEELWSAIEAECADLPPIYRATMLAGSASGHPGRSIELLASTAKRMQQVRQITGVAILYPLIVIAVASALFAFVVTAIVPSFAWLNHLHFGPLATLSKWPTMTICLAAALPTLALIFAVLWWWRSGTVAGSWSTRFGMFAWLPGARRIKKWSNAAECAELMLMMVENGVPLDQALHFMGEASQDRRIQRVAQQIAGNARHGSALVMGTDGSVSELNALPLLIRLALQHAANRPIFTSILRQASALYRDRALRAAESYIEFIPIVLTVAVGGSLTFAFALMVLWPYASALHEVAGATWR